MFFSHNYVARKLTRLHSLQLMGRFHYESAFNRTNAVQGSKSVSSFKRHSCPFGKEPIELKEDELYSQRMVNGLKKKDNSYQLFMRNLFRQKLINETFHSAFHMSGKSHTIGDFTVSRPSQIFPTYRERGSLRFRIFMRKNLERSGKNEISGCLGFFLTLQNKAYETKRKNEWFGF